MTKTRPSVTGQGPELFGRGIDLLFGGADEIPPAQPADLAEPLQPTSEHPAFAETLPLELGGTAPVPLELGGDGPAETVPLEPGGTAPVPLELGGDGPAEPLPLELGGSEPPVAPAAA